MRRLPIAPMLLVFLIAGTALAEAPTVQLPGAPAFDAELQAKLRAAWQAQGGNGERPSHTNPDGSPQYINRLVFSSSPYLQLHAYNPVNWYPWGDEAFAAAKRENKPVLVSIGYATCHWCHVMERECFDDPAIAEILNKNFIAIKVDREERPDLDAVYIAAVQRLTGSAGWPLNVFVTPDREPFYGGTYFPPQDRGNRPGFAKLLAALAASWQGKRDAVAQTAESLTASLKQSAAQPGGQLDEVVLRRGAAQFTSLFDTKNGGFGKPPKFPQVHTLQFLLRYWLRSGDPTARTMALLTLDHMSRGGINDLIGGGFHRYSTDAEWRIPHYEKMLYDQALNARAYIEAARASGSLEFSGTAREIFTYVLREMTAPDGGFYSAQDADSGGQEGTFYTWTRAEILAAVGPTDGPWVADFFGLTEGSERSPLTIPVPSEEFMTAHKIGQRPFITAMGKARVALVAARNQRPRPRRDDKIITAWNGLMIAALADGAAQIGDAKYTAGATRAANFVLTNLQRNGRLMRSYRGSVSATPGFLDDYAYLILGLHQLYEATYETRWLSEAVRLTKDMTRLFNDPANGSLRYVADDHEKLIAVPEALDDEALPAAQSAAAYELLRLGHLLQNPEFDARGKAILAANAKDIEKSPTAHAFMLLALDFMLGPQQEIVIAGSPKDEATKGLLLTVQRSYLPRAVLAVHAPDDRDIERLIPFIAKQTMSWGKPTAYVCENYECKLPTSDAAKLKEQLEPMTKPPKKQ